MSKTLEERFCEKVDVRLDGGCWEWVGWKNPGGYGRIRDDPPSRRALCAHRVSYSLLVEPIPQGAIIMHTCDNPGCVNPAHLMAGTQLDNMRDKSRKGRHGTAKLTAEQVGEIKRDHRPHSHVAADCGVNPATVSRIKCGKTWRHLLDDSC